MNNLITKILLLLLLGACIPIHAQLLNEVQGDDAASRRRTT